MLAEAGVRVLGIEGIEEERVSRLDWRWDEDRVEPRRREHFRWVPSLSEGGQERRRRIDHESTLHCKVLSVNQNFKRVVRLLQRIELQTIMIGAPVANVLLDRIWN